MPPPLLHKFEETDMTLRDDLIAAKALIDAPEKWGKGDFFLPNGCMCALGAVARVCGMDPNHDPINPRYRGTVQFLGKHVQTGENVWSFNDNPKTTHADVMAMYDRAIEASS